MNRELADNYTRAAMTRTYFPGQGLTVAALDTTYDVLTRVRAGSALAELDEHYPRPTATDFYVVARTHGVPVAVLVDAYDARLNGALTEMDPDYREPCEACGDADPVPGEDHCRACLNIIYGPLTDDGGPDDDGGEVPVILDVDGMSEWLQDYPGAVTADMLGTALHRLGRTDGPALLLDLHSAGTITTGVLAAHIGDVWSSAEYPDAALRHDLWRAMFTAAGYTVDGQPAERPAEPVRLYRGAVPERRSDWSWTDNREVAERYGSGDFYSRPAGKFWTALVEPWRLLARNTGRDEDEYVVDTDGLTITEMTK